MKKKLLVGLLMAGSSMFAETHVSIGIGSGGYGNGYNGYYAQPRPGPGYNWVNGYWYQAGPRRLWREGYWAPPVRSYRGEPRYRQYDYRYDDRRNERDRDRDRDRFDRR